MYQFSKISLERLSECHVFLQELMLYAIRNSKQDFSILCGYRDQEAQEKAFKEKKSLAKWGQSKHNQFPSLAIDIAPYPINWNDIERFDKLGNYIINCFEELNFKDIKLTWGKYFKNLIDWGHFEI
jgi:peptidoglycan L-alanyl-D-glutamate endopeptidase CwlK